MIHRSSLALIHDLCINLSCADIAIAEEFGDGVEVCSVGQCEGCEGVAVFSDSMRACGLIGRRCSPKRHCESCQSSSRVFWI